MLSHKVFPALLAVSSILPLTGCGREEAPNPDSVDPKTIRADVERGVGIAPASYAGDIAFKIPADLPIENEALPFVIYAGLGAVTQTRLGVKTFIDLRSIQARLPELLSGVLDESCKQEIVLTLIETEADGDLVRARGTIRARFYSCNRRDPDNEKQGTLWLSQNVDAVATAKATVQDQCLHFSLVDLELDPRGLLGGIANLFGLTERARAVILEDAREFLSKNPVCPAFPDEFASISPTFDDGGVREIGEGGIGAALSGSVDTSASTIVGLLAVLKEHDIVEGQR